MKLFNVKKASTPGEKLKGLIGSDGKTALYMQTRWGIHTFGMSFPIDLIILDRKNKVVKYKRNLKPNRVFFWSPIYNNVVEVPTALVPEGAVKIGDEIVDPVRNLINSKAGHSHV